MLSYVLLCPALPLLFLCLASLCCTEQFYAVPLLCGTSLHKSILHFAFAKLRFSLLFRCFAFAMLHLTSLLLYSTMLYTAFAMLNCSMLCLCSTLLYPAVLCHSPPLLHFTKHDITLQILCIIRDCCILSMSLEILLSF